MPEGDTIFRTAASLRRVLPGQVIRRADSREAAIAPDRLTDRTVTRIESRGKHLLIHFDSGDVLHSHMGMWGSWHIYAPGEPWRKPTHRAAVTIQTDRTCVVCFTPKMIKLCTPGELRGDRYLQRLGPDLLGPPLDVPEVLSRFRAVDRSPIGEALMNQTVVCGIGNVYKSEVLFLERCDPFSLVAAYTDQQIQSILDRSFKLMRRNLQGYPRRTRPGAAEHCLWVYGRLNEPCFECGERIAMRRQGDLGRSTYYCALCQNIHQSGTH